MAKLQISAGEARTFAIAGVRFTFDCQRSSRGPLRMSPSYLPFLSRESTDVSIRVAVRTRIEAASGRLLYDSGLHWRALEAEGSVVYQFRHPPTSELYCQATVDPGFSAAEVSFSKSAFRRFASSPSACWELPYPLDQLLLVPALAQRGAILVHACGALVSDRALVFAGHSGDGKTTLARLLSQEGTALLSDERIAIRRVNGGFSAFGTPWPGEGNVVSSASSPLSGLFVLRKAARHALGRASPALAADLLARAIVPYYLRDVATRILEIFSDLAACVPFRELHFARAAGLSSILLEAA